MTATEAEPFLVPLNAIFADDITEILIPIMSNNTVAELAGAVADHVEGKRVPARGLPKGVFLDGQRLDDSLTVAGSGISPMDHIRVDYVTDGEQ